MAKTKEIITEADLTLKLSSAVTLARWLQQLPLAGQSSRQRSQFCNMLSEVQASVEAKRTELLQKYSEKDENGKPKTYTDENDVEKFDLTEDNEKAFNTELSAFLDQPYALHFDADHIQLWNRIANILSTTDYKFSGNLALEYDSWLSAFEK